MKGILLLAVFALAGCTSLEKAPPAAVKDLAPGGKLRAAINYGNAVLAGRDAERRPKGVSVDLARELASRLGVPLEIVEFDAAGEVVAAAKDNVWDVAFVALDPKRAQEMEQSPPYVMIEGAYAVRANSPIRDNGDVDRPGNRIVVAKGSAYDLYLARTLRQAKLVHAPTTPQVVGFFLGGDYEVAASVKQQLEIDTAAVAPAGDARE